MSIFKSGFLLGLSLVVALGPQNLFVIRQAALKRFAILATLTCILCDMLLIQMSGRGVGSVLLRYNQLKYAMIGFGIAFLFYYAVQSLRAGILQFRSSDNVHNTTERSNMRWQTIIILGCSFTLLNPQALIDVLVIIGGNLSIYPHDLQYQYLYGVMAANTCWFLFLMLVSMAFSSCIEKPHVTAALDLLSGLMMLICALRLGFEAATNYL